MRWASHRALAGQVSRWSASADISLPYTLITSRATHRRMRQRFAFAYGRSASRPRAMMALLYGAGLPRSAVVGSISPTTTRSPAPSRSPARAATSASSTPPRRRRGSRCGSATAAPLPGPGATSNSGCRDCLRRRRGDVVSGPSPVPSPWRRRTRVPNGYGKPRQLTTRVGTVTVRRPQVRGLEQRCDSALLPLFARRTPDVNEVLPELYLRRSDGQRRTFRNTLGYTVRIARRGGVVPSELFVILPMSAHQRVEGVARSRIGTPPGRFHALGA